MSFQQWTLSTADQTVTEIDGQECGMTVAELAASGNGWDVETCESDVILFNTVMTGEEITIETTEDGGLIGAIIISGHRPTCA